MTLAAGRFDFARDYQGFPAGRVTERWLSGRKRRFAKPLYGLNRTGGSNPPLSARNRNSGKKPNGSTTGHPSRDRPHEVLQLLDAMLAGNGKAEIAAGFPAR